MQFTDLFLGVWVKLSTARQAARQAVNLPVIGGLTH